MGVPGTASEDQQILTYISLPWPALSRVRPDR